METLDFVDIWPEWKCSPFVEDDQTRVTKSIQIRKRGFISPLPKTTKDPELQKYIQRRLAIDAENKLILKGKKEHPTVDRDKLQLALNGTLPLCFDEDWEFADFCYDVQQAVVDSKPTPPVYIAIVGSSVHGWKSNSEKPMLPWDDDSDLDVTVFAPNELPKLAFKIEKNQHHPHIFQSNGKRGFYNMSPLGAALHQAAKKWNDYVHVTFKLAVKPTPGVHRNAIWIPIPADIRKLEFIKFEFRTVPPSRFVEKYPDERKCYHCRGYGTQECTGCDKNVCEACHTDHLKSQHSDLYFTSGNCTRCNYSITPLHGVYCDTCAHDLAEDPSIDEAFGFSRFGDSDDSSSDSSDYNPGLFGGS